MIKIRGSMLVVTLLLIACSTAAPREVATTTAPGTNGRSPVEFLDFLATMKRRPAVYTFNRREPCWVKRADMPDLLNRLNSIRPSLAVRMSEMSFLRSDSTEGDEAAYMIEGFRKGSYPPSAGSSKTTKQERDALEQWWRDYSSGKTEEEPGILKCQGTTPSIKPA